MSPTTRDSNLISNPVIQGIFIFGSYEHTQVYPLPPAHYWTAYIHVLRIPPFSILDFNQRMRVMDVIQKTYV